MSLTTLCTHAVRSGSLSLSVAAECSGQGMLIYLAQFVERLVAADQAAGAQLRVAVHVRVAVEAVLAAPASGLPCHVRVTPRLVLVVLWHQGLPSSRISLDGRAS
jgi:hypothetical protein